jgi:formate-dependent nitrite reductase cytochrome c552 subunit
MACHFERKVTDKGEIILRASAKACVGCHQGRKNLPKEWKKDLESMIKDTQEVEKETPAVLTKVKAKLSKAKLAKKTKILKEGRENFNLVRLGNGVHNKKYSMFVLDAAMVRFEDAIEYLEEGE